ncbi:MAG: aminomethyl-transferring glycine dehydrogenase subunit GcvPB [Firmicutes bacterium]|nr:aminomethyl-transferring glycine dehydrogenase subunit GcvPB [Bacillota bacterium]
MQLIFERSREGRRCALLPTSDVDIKEIPAEFLRAQAPKLPMVSEIDLSRHYTELEKQVHGVNDGFYPLGSCTMKYNPQVNNEMAGLPGFANIHPLQDEASVQGALELLHTTKEYLCEITGMDEMTFQTSAGAHGEFGGVLMIKAYHESRGDHHRKKIMIPDAAHGTNPATATMAGFTVVTIPSDENGHVDLEKLRAEVGPDTAGLMLTNPNTLGLFDPNILEITKIIHDAGGLCYYDGANINPIMGVVRPGDMGFDVIHLNLHKSFSTPHGGGGPGSGPVGCKNILAPFLPKYNVVKEGDKYRFDNSEQSIGMMKGFYGNFLVNVRALSYLMTLGAEGPKQVAENATLNANYMMEKLAHKFDVAYPGICMHEFVVTMNRVKRETGVNALDMAKGMLDYGIHPPTMYFPILVGEALMFEPTETESKETMDEAIEIYLELYDKAYSDPEYLKNAPYNTPIKRPDEVGAARNPKVRYIFPEN